MATEKPPTASEALANLEQQLTCPVCLDHYTKPRTLPCLHSFCHGCLAHFPVQVQGGKHFITCPVCRLTTQQPDKGVSGFQSAFLINNLLFLYQVLEKVCGSKQNNCENCHKEQATGYCSQPLQFWCPIGVAVHRNGQVFVSDTGNNRVQVLNADLTYSHCFGSKGVQPGEFYSPRDIAIDADGMVYVADYSNNRVQKFTPEGKLLAVIDSKGAGNGRLNLPYGLCFDANGILYVTETGSKTVSMFSSNGKFLGYIGDSDGSSFKHPVFIVSNKTGRLYISGNNGVVTY